MNAYRQKYSEELKDKKRYYWCYPCGLRTVHWDPEKRKWVCARCEAEHETAQR